MENNTGEIIIYQTDSGENKLEVTLEKESVWLSIEQMATLFNKARSTINEHILNIYKEQELIDTYINRKIGNSDFPTKPTNLYNLDMIIAVGYRVKSPQGIQFRMWATERLKEYIVKGFTIDDERLKGNTGGNYWKELLDRIRDIRSSEKVLYRQVLDLYATSRDYNPDTKEARKFFKTVQNKLHYAAHGHTASEIIYKRADSNKVSMGLTTFKGALPTKKEAQTAKNYLNEKELKILNNLVSGYFDFAEIHTQRHEHLYMADHLAYLDTILLATGSEVLQNAGTISHKNAMTKVDTEYKKYQEKTQTPVETSYVESIKNIEQIAKKGATNNE